MRGINQVLLCILLLVELSGVDDEGVYRGGIGEICRSATSRRVTTRVVSSGSRKSNVVGENVCTRAK